MAQYYNPPTDIPRIGRLLRTSNSLNTLQSQLQPGETLVTYADRAIFKFAQLTTSERDFSDIEEQYRRGRLLSRNFYAVPVEKLESHLEGL